MIIGIAGTAKNTGKTTALAALINAAKNLTIGVTGIGYDGEERDTITMLPKPRIVLPAGTIATTSEMCFPVSTAGWDVLHRTGMTTPLGEVLVLRITRPGLLVIAGPNKTSDLRSVCTLMAAHVGGPIFVDGSLNRIAPMAVAQRVVIATGAARSTDIPRLTEETVCIEEAFALPRLSPNEAMGEAEPGNVSLYQKEDVLAAVAGHARRMNVKGVVGLDALESLAVHAATLESVTFDGPLQLLLSGDSVRAMSALRALRERGIQVSVREAQQLSAVTVNPYYPAYSGVNYSPAYVDKAALLASFRKQLHVPVVDIMQEGADKLLTLLLSGNPA
jgi:hypothetical protein